MLSSKVTWESQKTCPSGVQLQFQIFQLTGTRVRVRVPEVTR